MKSKMESRELVKAKAAALVAPSFNAMLHIGFKVISEVLEMLRAS